MKTLFPYKLFMSRETITKVELPEVDIERNLGILDFDIEKLKKSNVFPYGLTEDKIQRLKSSGYETVGQLAEATEMQLRGIHMIGNATVVRIKNVVEQAIWM